MIFKLKGASKSAPTTTLNDIPDETIFTGEIESSSTPGWIFKGLFFKTSRRVLEGEEYTPTLVIGLTDENPLKIVPIWKLPFSCMPVRNYRAVKSASIEVEL